jgi:hypothetical protein
VTAALEQPILVSASLAALLPNGAARPLGQHALKDIEGSKPSTRPPSPERGGGAHRMDRIRGKKRFRDARRSLCSAVENAQLAISVEEFANSPPPTADARVRQLYDHWHELRPAPGVLPGRQHFDPTALSPSVLPFLWLADVQRSPLRFRYRLLGTEHVRVLGRDYTGQWIDEAHPAFLRSTAYHQFVAAAERAAVGYRSGDTLIILPKDYRSMERLLLPLARDGRRVDMLLAISVYHRAA